MKYAWWAFLFFVGGVIGGITLASPHAQAADVDPVRPAVTAPAMSIAQKLSPIPNKQTMAHKEIDCLCRYSNGQDFALGSEMCIRVDGKAYMARCEMVLNNTHWRKISDGCPTI